MGRRIPVVVKGHMQSPETSHSHQPINPPVDKDAGENNERHSEEQRAKDNPPSAEGDEAPPAEEHPQPKKENGTQPEEQGRTKKRFGWIRKYRVVLGAISTAIVIVFSLMRIADLYVSRRAYVRLDSDTKEVVSVLPGNEGFEIHLRNNGQTLVTHLTR